MELCACHNPFGNPFDFKIDRDPFRNFQFECSILKLIVVIHFAICNWKIVFYWSKHAKNNR